MDNTFEQIRNILNRPFCEADFIGFKKKTLIILPEENIFITITIKKNRHVYFDINFLYSKFRVLMCLYCIAKKKKKYACYKNNKIIQHM